MDTVKYGRLTVKIQLDLNGWENFVAQLAYVLTIQMIRAVEILQLLLQILQLQQKILQL